MAELGTGSRCDRDTDKTDKDPHVTCQAAAVGGFTPHPTAPRAADTPEARTRTLRWTSAPSVSTCDASLPREAGRELRTPDAASRRTAAATQGPSSLRSRPAPPPAGGVQDTHPAPRAQQGRAAHAPRGSQPSPSGAPGRQKGRLSGVSLGETEAGSSREEGWGLEGAETMAGR